MVSEEVDRGPEPALDRLVASTQGHQPWRRVFHAGMGLGIAGALWYFEPERGLAVALLGLASALHFVGDWLRLSFPRLNLLFFRVLRPLASPREAEGFASSAWYALGCCLTVALFPLGIAVSAILVLALADSAASWIGRVWGRRPFGSGTLEGSLAFTLVAFVLLAARHGWVVAAITAFVVSFLERTPWKVDDNLVTPLATGGTLWVLEALLV